MDMEAVTQRPASSNLRRRVTISDVARACGVAPSTVSRALTRPGRVNAETAEHIRQVALTLGYRPAPPACPTASSKSGVIALVVADATNPAYGEILRGAQEAAADAGYTIQLNDSQESDRLERDSLERVLPGVDGLLLASSRMSDSAIRVMARQKPTILLNRATADIPCRVVDSAGGIRRSVEHLAALGHDRITYVAGPEGSWADGVRWRSLREAATELEIKLRRTGPFPPTVEAGVHAAAGLASRPLSAVIAYNDQLAVGLMHGLTEMGVRVPQDVSIVGFDNTYLADLVTPGLTTVAAPLREAGLSAARHLIAMVTGTQPPGRHRVLLPTRLVVRASTARYERGKPRAARSGARGTPQGPGRGTVPLALVAMKGTERRCQAV